MQQKRNQSRIDDMLRYYGDTSIAAASMVASTQLTTTEQTELRRRGECAGWVEHDAYFLWSTRLTNTFAELSQFVTSIATNCQQPRNWDELRRTAVIAATSLLLQQPDPLPLLLPPDMLLQWWQLVAVVHECDAVNRNQRPATGWVVQCRGSMNSTKNLPYVRLAAVQES